MKGKYQKQLRQVFMAMGTILVLVFIIILSFTLINSFKAKYSSSVKQSVSSRETLAEVSLSTINSAMAQMMQDAAISQWAASASKSSYYYNAIDVHENLSNLRRTFSNIPFFPAVTRLKEDTFVISSAGSSSKEEYFQSETSLTGEQISYIFEYFKDNTGDLILPTYAPSGSLEDIYYITRKPFDRRDLIYIIRIPRSSILGSDSTQSFLLFDQNKILAYSDNSATSVAKMDQTFASLTQIVAESQEMPTALASSDTPYHILGSQVFISQYSRAPWRTAYLYDDAAIDMTTLFWSLFIPFLILALLFYLGFQLLANWLYHPIKEVMNHVEISGASPLVDEFQLLKQNASTVKELSGRLLSVMSQNDSLITQRFYRDVIAGMDTHKNPLYQNMVFEEQDYCVALFQFQEPAEQNLDQDIFFIKNSLMTLIQQNGTMQGISINHTDYAVLLSSHSLEDAKVQIMSLINQLSDDIEFFTALSTIRTGLSQVHHSYVEACNILEYKYLYPGARLLTAEQVFMKKSINYYYPIIMENRVIQSMAEGKEQALLTFDDLIRENFSHRDLTPDTLRSLLYSLLSTVTRSFQELKTTPEELLGHSIAYEDFYSNWSNPNIIRSIRELIEEVIEAVRGNHASSDNEILKEMQTYIYEHYSTDIMLSDMADSLGISAKYCSNLFKKLSDDNFKNFLNKYRIERAKEIIMNSPNLKIADLSLMVGFNSSNTFIRVFGKYTGMTPGNYLKSVGKEELSDSKEFTE